MGEMSVDLRTLYRHYISRARRLRSFAYLFMSVTYSLLFLIAIFAASNALIPDHRFNTANTLFDRLLKDLEKAKTINPPLGPQDINDVAINAVTETSVAVGNDGLILRSEDEGRSWTRVDSGIRDDLNVVAFSKDGDTALVGGDGGAVLFSTDDGQSWQRPEGATHTNKAFYDAALSSDGRIAAAVGRRGLIRVSLDRGNSWIDPGNVTPKDLNGVVLSRDGKTVVAAGDDGTILVAATEQAKYHEKWITVEVDDDSGKKSRKDFEALALGGERGETVVAVGDDGLIWSSTDPEKKWEKWNSLGKEERRDDFRALAFSGDGRTAMAVGSRGLIRVSNGWKPEKSGVGDRLEAISLSHDGTIAVAAGSDGTIVVSTDKGGWRSPASRTANRLYAVALSGDGQWAAAVGRDETLLRVTPIGKDGPPEVAVIPVPAAPEPPPLNLTEFFQVTLYYKGFFWPIGSILIVMFMVRYLILLTKYYLRLSGFYYARGDAILLCNSKTLPRPATIGELDQLIRALSPEELEFDRTPRSVMKQALGMVRYSFRERKPSKTLPGDG